MTPRPLPPWRSRGEVDTLPLRHEQCFCDSVTLPFRHTLAAHGVDQDLKPRMNPTQKVSRGR